MKEQSINIAGFENVLADLALGENALSSLLEAEETLSSLAEVFFPFNVALQSSKLQEGQNGIDLLDDDEPDLSSVYRVLVEQIPAIVFMAFLDKGISQAYVSPQIESMLGFKQAEWLNEPVRWFAQLHHEDKTRWSVEAAQMFLTGEPLKSNYRVLSRDNRVVWFHCEAKMVRRKDGRPWFIHGIAFDITELKNKELELQLAHDELQQRERLLRGIFDYAPDTMFLVDMQGDIVRVNAQVERMFGYEPRELIGKQIEELLPARFRRGHIHHRHDYNSSPHLRTMGAGLELYGLKKDGGEFPADITLSPVETEAGSLVIAVVRDISRRKHDEEVLRDNAERLQILSRRLMEVQEAERRRIALELHDEIGQTLTGLKLTLEMASRSDTGKEVITNAKEIVNELMARVRKLSLDLRPGMLDDLGLLPAVLWLIENYSSQTRIRVAFKHLGLEGRRFAPEIETASYRIVQEALTNIARHAKVDEAKVLLSANDEELVIEIEDNGKGFEPEKVFEANSSSGLAGMRERALLLGGSFQIESNTKQGARLTARLKIKENHGAL